MTVQMNHGTGGVVTLQAPSTGTATVTIPARDGTLALGGPVISFNSAGTVLSGSGCTVAEVSTGIYDVTRTTAASNANYGVIPVAWTADSGSVNLDGSNDYITATSLAALSGQSAFTVFGRYKLNSTVSQSACLFQQRQDSSKLSGVRAFSDGNIYVYDDSEANNYGWASAATVGVTAGTWFTFAAVFDGGLSGNSNRMKIFFNATQATLSFSGTIGSSFAANTGAFEVGRWNSGGSFTYGNMAVSNIRVYTTALTSGDITNLHNGIDVGSPALQWKFTDLSGTTVTDSSGNSRNGTLTNGPTWSTVDGSGLIGRVLSRTTTVTRVEFRTSGGVLTKPAEAAVSMLA